MRPLGIEDLQKVHDGLSFVVKMKAAIITKLADTLRKGIQSEESVVYFLVELRKLIELNEDGDNYRALNFHCDWTAHPILDRKEAKRIVGLFDRYQSVIEKLETVQEGNTIADDTRFFAELGPILTMSHFRNELNTYLRAQGLDSTIADDNALWARFLGYYAAVIEDCPLKCITQGLQFVEEVTLRVFDIQPEEQAAANGFRLAIEWIWVSKTSGSEHRNVQMY